MFRTRELALCTALLLATIRPLLAQAPGSLESYLNEARIAMEARSYWMAAIQLRQAVALAPDHAEAHLLLGAALASDGAWEEARGHLGRAIQIDPKLADEANRWLAGAPGSSTPPGATRQTPAPAPAPAPARRPEQPRRSERPGQPGQPGQTGQTGQTGPAAGALFRVGDAVEVEHVPGVWRAGVVVRVNAADCANYIVRYTPYANGEAELPFWCGSIRAPTGATTPHEAAPAGGALALGDYVCDYRPNLSSIPQQRGTITLLADGRYTYLGDPGRFRYDEAAGTIAWLTGPLADRGPERTRYRRNQTTTQMDLRFGEANEWSCGHNLRR